MPSPYAAIGRRATRRRSTRPSMYFRNSQARRDLPMPAGPMTLTRRGRPSRPVAWKRSLSWRSSSSRPTNGASSASDRPTPPRCATTRRARHAGTGLTLPLRTWSPAGSKTIAPAAARWVASPTSTVEGGATLCSRLAVLTMSPLTMPWLVAPRVTAASPVRTPARTSMPGPGRGPRPPARGRRGRHARRRPRGRSGRPRAP